MLHSAHNIICSVHTTITTVYNNYCCFHIQSAYPQLAMRADVDLWPIRSTGRLTFSPRRFAGLTTLMHSADATRKSRPRPAASPINVYALKTSAVCPSQVSITYLNGHLRVRCDPGHRPLPCTPTHALDSLVMSWLLFLTA